MDERLEQVPGIARITAGAAWRSTVWAAGATRRTGRLALRTVADPEASAELVAEVARDVAEAARTVSTVARRIQDGTPIASALTESIPVLGATLHGAVRGEGDAAAEPRSGPPDPQDLRARGARLLERSRDVWSEDDTHPAFARILDDLAPDEARILVHLVRAGPQPSVDVRTGGPVGMVSSQLLAPGLTMVGARAGVRHPDRVPAYLDNLDRLGLVRLSPEPVTDPMDYQVLEAQPHVLAAVHSVTFAKMVRRSIHLTPFGEEFCRTCLLEPEQAPLPPDAPES